MSDDVMNEVRRVAAFCAGTPGKLHGGNPAGVWIGAALPSEETMRRVRYFSPESEVPFCGHATIGLGAVLALERGTGTYPLRTNHAAVTVDGDAGDGAIAASLVSPPASGTAAPPPVVDDALALFGYTRADLDERIPPALANGGSAHLILPLKTRAALAAMRYDLEAGRVLMGREGWTTIALVHAESAQRFHARNPFAAGGVYEDPATGSAAAALAGYLRDIGFTHEPIDIVQGADMGVPCQLRAHALPGQGSPARVSGTVRPIAQAAE